LTYIADHLPLYALRMEAVYHSDTVGNCNHCVADHYYEWDFTQSPDGWALSMADGVAGTWVSGQGYVSTLRYSTGSIADELRMGTSFNSDFSRKLVRIEIDMEFTRGEVEFPAAQRGEISIKDTTAAQTLFLKNASFDGAIAENKDLFLRSNMVLVALASYENSVTPSPRGNVEFRKAKVWYNGALANFTGGTGF
jgi:hypothetical protein